MVVVFLFVSSLRPQTVASGTSKYIHRIVYIMNLPAPSIIKPISKDRSLSLDHCVAFFSVLKEERCSQNQPIWFVKPIDLHSILLPTWSVHWHDIIANHYLPVHNRFFVEADSLTSWNCIYYWWGNVVGLLIDRQNFKQLIDKGCYTKVAIGLHTIVNGW